MTAHPLTPMALFILILVFFLSLFTVIVLFLYIRYKKNDTTVDRYVEEISDMVGGTWEKMSNVDGVQKSNYAISARFTVLRDGIITGIEITHSSGSEPDDALVIEAIEKSSPLPKIPLDCPKEKIEMEMTFQNM